MEKRSVTRIAMRYWHTLKVSQSFHGRRRAKRRRGYKSGLDRDINDIKTFDQQL